MGDVPSCTTALQGALSPDLHRANDGAAGPPMQDLAAFDSPPTGAVENFHVDSHAAK